MAQLALKVKGSQPIRLFPYGGVGGDFGLEPSGFPFMPLGFLGAPRRLRHSPSVTDSTEAAAMGRADAPRTVDGYIWSLVHEEPMASGETMSDGAAGAETAGAEVNRRGDLVKKLDDGDWLALLSLLEVAGAKITGPVTVRLEQPAKPPITDPG